MLHHQNKKGISIIFTWIFVLLAGAVILGVLITIAYKGAQSSEKVTSVRYIDLLRNIIVNFASSIEGSKVVDLPGEIDAQLGCNEIVMFREGDSFSRDINKVFFAPSNIIDDELVLWNLPWYFPFRVGDILYLSAPNMKYYFVYDSSNQELVDDFVDGVSDKFNLGKINIQGLNLNKIQEEVNTMRYFNVRFVFFSEPSDNVLDSIKNLGWSAVFLDGDVVKYYEAQVRSLKIIGDELKYGAVFSDDFLNYKCGVERAMEEVEIISLLYAEKARLLTIKSPRCFYSNIRSSLTQYSQLSKSLNMDALNSGMQVLIGQNKQLDRQDCAVVF